MSRDHHTPASAQAECIGTRCGAIESPSCQGGESSSAPGALSLFEADNTGFAKAIIVRTLKSASQCGLSVAAVAKLIMTSDGAAVPTPKPRRDETLVRALVRAHRWRRRIESGQAKSITDLAEQENVTDAYVCRLLPLTCLAPDIVEAILDGRQPMGLRLTEMLGNGPFAWNDQRERLGFSN